MSAKTAPRVALSTPRVAEASCLAREPAAAVAAGKAFNNVDTKECGHHLFPASSSVVFAVSVAAVVKGSCRQCVSAACGERFGVLVGTLACERAE